MGFVKLDGSILISSIWAESMETKLVWITMLAMADKSGLVQATAPGISHTSGVPIDKTRKALEILSAPDPDSKSLENDGRRVERMDGGYLVLNYEKYRGYTYSASERAVYMREYRERKKKEEELQCNKKGNSVITAELHSASASSSASSSISFLRPKIEEIRSYISEKNYSVDPEKFFDFYESKGWMIGKNKMKDWKAAVRTWQRSDFGSSTSKAGKGVPAKMIYNSAWEKEHQYDDWMTVENDGRKKIEEMVALYEENLDRLSDTNKKILEIWKLDLGVK